LITVGDLRVRDPIVRRIKVRVIAKLLQHRGNL
jgi:hypothetical protein